MNSSKAGVPEALVQHLESWRGDIFLLRGDDPDDVAIRLERINLFDTEEKIFFADFPHYSSRLRNPRLAGDLLKLRHPLGSFPFGEPPGPLNGIPQPFAAHRLQQIVDRARVKCLKGVLVISGDDYDHRHVRPALEISDYLQPAHHGHLKIQQDKVGMIRRYFFQSESAIVRLSDDFHVVERSELLAQYLPRNRLVVPDQRSQRHARVQILFARP